MKTVQTKMHPFETSDIGLAATLHALGEPIISIDRKDVGRCLFLFNPRVQGSVQLYWNHELALDPQAVLLSLKLLKSRLYNERSTITPYFSSAAVGIR